MRVDNAKKCIESDESILLVKCKEREVPKYENRVSHYAE